MTKYEYIIAIDPDCDKSGMAWIECKTKQLAIFSLSFPELIEKLTQGRGIIPKTLIVVEAGWLNKSNWHLNSKDNRRTASAKGNSTGRNHETGRKIIEMCQYLGLDHQLIRPTKHKTDATAFAQLTGFKKRTNQEQRDACMLVYGM